MTRAYATRFLGLGLVLVGALAGCGGGGDPFAADIDGGAGTIDGGNTPTIDGGNTPTADAGAQRQCAPTPKRLVVLGDSITDCSVIGGPQNASCVSKIFYDYVKANYAPDLVYEPHAVGGAKTADVLTQLSGLPSEAGPALVMIYIGGNDLAPYIFQSDTAAMSGYTAMMPAINDNWASFFTTFADESKFPGGTTVIMNNQYNPFDDCTASPYNLSPLKATLLHEFNAVLVDIANQHFENTIIIDQYTPFLGHGHHYDVATCPHYMAGAAPYMQDLIHANAAGNMELAARLAEGADRLYRDCTP